MPEYIIEVVSDTLRLLEVVGENPGIRLPELAQRSQLTKTKTFRILRTLETSGYIVQDSAQTYYLDQKAYLIGQQAKNQWSLARVTKPFLDELAEATQENIHLVIREGLSSVVIAIRESSHPIRMYAEVGRRGPLHAGGTPKVLLAYAPSEVLEQVLNGPLPAFTHQTLISKENLNTTLETIRQNGYHIAKRDLDADAFSIAAPIIGVKKTIIAAISIAGPMMRLNPKLEERYVELICHAARRISHQLSNGISDT